MNVTDYKNAHEHGWRRTLKLCQVGSKLIETVDMKQSGKAVVNPPILMKKIHAAKSLGWRQVKG